MSEPLAFDLTYTSQRATVGLELRSQDELDRLVAALQNGDTKTLYIQNHYRDITVAIYFRFRERQRTSGE